jgi:hypothetical protein
MFIAKLALLSPALLVLMYANAHAKDEQSSNSALAMTITCEIKTTPAQFVSLIKNTQGGSIISGNHGVQQDGEFTVSSPVNIWGFNVTHFSYHFGSNDDGDFTEYRAIIPNQSNTLTAQSVAQIAGIPKIADNYYYKAVGNNDLLVRKYGDDIIVSCADDVRTVKKSINKFIRNL